MAKNTGDPRGPGMRGSGGWVHTQDDGPQEVKVRSSAGDLTWNFEDVWPFGGVYVREDDVLQIQVFQNNIIAINLQYRILRPDGTVLVSQDVVQTAASRVAQFTSRQLAEGILLSVTVCLSLPTNGVNYIYVSIGLRRQNLGAQGIHQLLCAGFVTQLCPLSWPGHTLQRPTDGAGVYRSITGTVPASGSDLTKVVSGGSAG
jgi:hypothetical protein